MNVIKPILSFFLGIFCSSLQANVSDYLNHIKKNPNALYAFFKTMPKGGELHYHLAGGAYPETMLKIAAKGDYCVDKNFSITRDSSHCDGVMSKDIFTQPDFYLRVVKDWSLKDFIPGEETGQQHFFKGFSKYMPIIFDNRPQLLADIIQRAAQQEEQYLELMDIPDNANSLSFGSLISKANSYTEKKDILLANKDFQNNIHNTVLESDHMYEQARDVLGCKKFPQNKACAVNVKFLYYMLREQPLDNLFAQTLNAFEAVSKSKSSLVGVNLVQPEDGIVSLRDYRKQMELFKYFHQLYPHVNISLHAGELAPERVEPEELGFHIHDAIFTGNAQRIGHGVDIGYENDSDATLKYMSEHHIPVEINLISNLKILNISGRNHPLHFYLEHHVPLVLSTDDEGVLRTDLTRQYVEAVLGHNLNYSQIKQINRNALTYAFLPGNSIWVDADTDTVVPQCKDINSKECLRYIKNSEKATLQWNLEQKLKVFEDKFVTYQ